MRLTAGLKSELFPWRPLRKLWDWQLGLKETFFFLNATAEEGFFVVVFHSLQTVEARKKYLLLVLLTSQLGVTTVDSPSLHPLNFSEIFPFSSCLAAPSSISFVQIHYPSSAHVHRSKILKYKYNINKRQDQVWFYHHNIKVKGQLLCAIIMHY